MEYLIVNEGLETEAAFERYKTTILKKKKDSTWEIVSSFEDQGADPILDLDGDGFPELVGCTGYKSLIIRKVIPDKKIVMKNTSGMQCAR